MIEHDIPSPRKPYKELFKPGQVSLHDTLKDIAVTYYQKLADAQTREEYVKAKRESSFATELLKQATLLAREHQVNPGEIPVRTEIVVFQASQPSKPTEPETNTIETPDEVELLLQMNSVGRALSHLRNGKKWSQDVLAGFSGISESTVDKVERGIRYPSPMALEKICDGLGLDLFDPRRSVLHQLAMNERIQKSRTHQKSVMNNGTPLKQSL